MNNSATDRLNTKGKPPTIMATASNVVAEM
jgi:hypothetical protein